MGGDVSENHVSLPGERSRSAGSSTGHAEREPPLVSVVIPVYNRRESIARAVASVLEQDVSRVEILIVDDGSTDGTSDLVRSFGDPRVHLLGDGRRRGVSGARNLGAAAAEGGILTFLDSDDEALAGWLDAFLGSFQDTSVGLVCVGVERLEERNDVQRPISIQLPAPAPHYGHRPVLFLAGSFAVRRELFSEIGGYDEDLRFAENSELAMRLVPHCLARDYRLAFQARPLLRYHIEADRQTPPCHVRDAAVRILDNHGPWLLETFPTGFANYCGVAAVNSARMDDLSATRRYLSKAIRVDPLRIVGYLRWTITLFPPLARRLWSSSPKPGGTR